MSPATLSPRVIWLWRAQGALSALLFWLPASQVAAVMGGRFIGWWTAEALALGWVALQLLRAFLWPSLSWRAFSYTLDDATLTVQQGVLFRHSVCVPRDRIQHLDTRQGPVERLFGLASLIVYTAAGLNADASLPGLELADAERLRHQLTGARTDAPRGDSGV